MMYEFEEKEYGNGNRGRVGFDLFRRVCGEVGPLILVLRYFRNDDTFHLQSNLTLLLQNQFYF